MTIKFVSLIFHLHYLVVVGVFRARVRLGRPMRLVERNSHEGLACEYSQLSCFVNCCTDEIILTHA